MSTKPASLHAPLFSKRLHAPAWMTSVCATALLSCDGSVPQEVDERAAALSSGADVERARTLKALEVSPASAVLIADLNKTATRTFKVLARYDDRSTANVTALSTFSVDNPSVGTMIGPSFESAVRASAQVDFGQVTVRYREGAVELTARVKLTVAWLHTSGPSKDVLFTLPYKGRTESATLGTGSSLKALDAFFAVDTTGSMGGEINSINRSLQTTIIPEIRAVVADSSFGVGAVEDFPDGSFGSPSCYGGGLDDQPFILLQPITSDLMVLQNGFQQLMRGSGPRGCGADTPEGQMEALYQIATGDGNLLGSANIPAHHTGRGGVEFRNGALPVVSMITDASFHTIGEPSRTCYGATLDYSGGVATAAHSRADTTAALKSVCARVVGVSVELGSEAGCLAHADLTQMATDTGALVQPEAWDAAGPRPASCAATECCTGLGGKGEPANAGGMCPLVYKGRSDGIEIGTQVADGIAQVARFAPSDVNLTKSGSATAIDGTPLPAGKTTADFLLSIKALDGTPPISPAGLRTPMASGDHFTGVVPGSALRFTIEARNDFLPATAKPQVLRAKLASQAGGCAKLDERDVFIVVPAT